jgi:hypothetical protein
MAEAFASANPVAEDLSNELFVNGDSIAADAVAKQIAIARQALKIIFNCRFMDITTCIGASPPRMISPDAFRCEQLPPPLIRFPVPEVTCYTRNDFLPASPDTSAVPGQEDRRPGAEVILGQDTRAEFTAV